MPDSLHRDIMTSVSLHLRPAPYLYGMLALRVLGKLGGRNRRFLRDLFPPLSGHDGIIKDGDNTNPQPPTAGDPTLYLEFVTRGSSQSADSQKPNEPIKLSLTSAITGACDLLDKLTVFAPVEAEVASLLGSYPEMTVGYLLEDGPGVKPDTFTASSSHLCEHIAEAPSTPVPSLQTEDEDMQLAVSEVRGREKSSSSRSEEVSSETGSAFSADLKSNAARLHSLLAKEVKYIATSNFCNQKKYALHVIIAIASHIIGDSHRFPNPKASVYRKVDDLESFNITGREVMEDMFSTACWEENCSVVEAELRRLVVALVKASGDPLLKDTSREFLRGLCNHIARLAMKGHHGFDEVHNLESAASVPVLSDPLSFRLCSVINAALMDAASDCRPAVYRAGLVLLNEWLGSLDHAKMRNLALKGGTDLPQSLGIDPSKKCSSLNSRCFPVSDLVVKSIEACSGSFWLRRVSGIRIIHELCAVLPPGWCVQDEHLLVGGLLSSLSLASSEIVVESSEDVFACIKRVLQSCHSSIDAQKGPRIEDPADNRMRDLAVTETFVSSSSTFVGQPTVDVLVRALCNPCTLVRVAAKASLRRIAKLIGKSIVEMLRGTHIVVSEVLSDACHVTWLNNAEDVARVSCLAYLLGVEKTSKSTDDQPLHLVPLNSLVLDVTRKAIEVTSADTFPPDLFKGTRSSVKEPATSEFGVSEDFNLLVSSLPSGVPPQVELRLHVIRLIQVN